MDEEEKKTEEVGVFPATEDTDSTKEASKAEMEDGVAQSVADAALGDAAGDADVVGADATGAPAKTPAAAATTQNTKENPTQLYPLLSTPSTRTSKRMIRQPMRFDTSLHHLSVSALLLLQHKRGKVGTGFHCPRCDEHLSYDVTGGCWKCGLACRYEAGEGVVVGRSRDQREVDLDWLDMDLLAQDNDHATRSRFQPDYALAHNPQRTNNKQTDNSSNSNKPLHPSTSTPNHRLLSTSPSSSTPPRTDPALAATASQRTTVVECEVCLRLFPATYITSHRLKAHKLVSDRYGCPYCDNTFASQETRFKHIRTKHRGKKCALTQEEKDRFRCFTYCCLICRNRQRHNHDNTNDNTYIYADLQKHFKEQHSTDVKSNLHRIAAVCPFCPTDHGGTKTQNTRRRMVQNNNNNNQQQRSIRQQFQTLKQLMEHIDTEHQGCSLIGMKLKIGDGSTTRSTTRRQCTYASSSLIDEDDREQEEVKVVEEEQEEIQQHNQENENGHESSTVKREWAPLSIQRLLTPTGKRTYAGLIQTIENKLRGLDKLQRVAAVVVDDEEYKRETRLYNRTVRERVGMLEREKLEKINYRDQVEDMGLRLGYLNRARKRSKADVEFKELLRRPITFYGSIKDEDEKKGEQEGRGTGVGSPRSGTPRAAKRRRSTRECRSIYASPNRHRGGGSPATGESQAEACPVGIGCALCGDFYASWIVTDEERRKAGGDVSTTTEQGCYGGEGMGEILYPPPRRFEGYDDIPDDLEPPAPLPPPPTSQQAEKVGCKGGSNVRRTRSSKGGRQRYKYGAGSGRGEHDVKANEKKSLDALKEIWKLNSLKYAAEFVFKYNKGLES